MKGLAAWLVIVTGIGIVDVVDSGVALVQFHGTNNTILDNHIMLEQIPCKIKEGDMIYAFKVKGITVYRCVPARNKKENKK